MKQVVMTLGPPASGKSSLSKKFISQGYTHLSRDVEGGKVIDLLPKLKARLDRSSLGVILDCTFPTPESRAPFIAACKNLGVPIIAEFMNTSTEDCVINCLHRMWDRYGTVFLTPEDIKAHDRASKDSNIFPIAVHFVYKAKAGEFKGKKFAGWKLPTKDEGFADVTIHGFNRRPLGPKYKHSAIIFDADKTLRVTKDPKGKWPTKPDEVVLMDGRKEGVAKLKDQYDFMLGVSNQSGVARGMPYQAAVDCLAQTNKLLEQNIEWTMCPHSVPPRCYCRKPQSGLGVYLIETYKLDPAKCVYVGDQTTDKTFAKRLGFGYVDAEELFND